MCRYVACLHILTKLSRRHRGTTVIWYHLGLPRRVYLQGNKITALSPGLYDDYNGTFLYLYMANNQVTSLVEDSFAGFMSDHLYVYLEQNLITSLSPGAFSFTRYVHSRHAVAALRM